MSNETEEKPRRCISAYMFYVQACWKEQHKNHPNQKVDFRQFSKDCGHQWRDMSAHDKSRYQALQEKDKKRYDAEIVKYRAKEEERKKSIPRRPLSAFFWFCNEERPKVREAMAGMPNVTVAVIAKELGRRWQLCPEKQKLKFEAISTKDRARYQKEKEAIKAEMEAADKENGHRDHKAHQSRSGSESQASESSGDGPSSDAED